MSTKDNKKTRGTLERKRGGGGGEKGVVVQRGNRGDRSSDMHSKASRHFKGYQGLQEKYCLSSPMS